MTWTKRDEAQSLYERAFGPEGVDRTVFISVAIDAAVEETLKKVDARVVETVRAMLAVERGKAESTGMPQETRVEQPVANAGPITHNDVRMWYGKSPVGESAWEAIAKEVNARMAKAREDATAKEREAWRTTVRAAAKTHSAGEAVSFALSEDDDDWAEFAGTGAAADAATAKANAEWSSSLGYGLDPTNPSDVLTPKSPSDCGLMLVHLHKERDAAVHQARVDGMAAGMRRAQAICNDYAACAPDDAHKSAGLDLAQELAFACGRLEREQAKPPAPTPPSHGPEQGRCPECGCGSGAHLARDTGDRKACSKAFGESAQPAEAKGAPEQARFIKDDDGYWIETRDESESATVFVPIDVVERRVAESRKQYDAETEQACAELIEAGKVLGCQAAEPTLSGARRVVAKRDAAEAKAKGNYDEGMKQMLRADCAERAIEGAKHLLAVEVERANGLERELANLRAEHADSAMADKNAEVERLRVALVQAKTFASHVKRAPEGWGYSVKETIFDRMRESATDLIADIDAALSPQGKVGG